MLGAGLASDVTLSAGSNPLRRACADRLGTRRQMLLDPAISRGDERHATLPVGKVVAEVAWQPRAPGGDEVAEQEEVDVALEVAEQGEELAV